MFKNISWTNYGLFVLIILIVYYATVAVLYYLNEIKQVFSGKLGLLLNLNPSKKLVPKNHLQPDNSVNDKGFIQQSKQGLHPLANECMNDINNALQYAAKNNAVKQEIMYSLRQLINKYPSINDNSFKSFITNYIHIECANYCSIHLDEDEVKGLWVN